MGGTKTERKSLIRGDRNGPRRHLRSRGLSNRDLRKGAVDKGGVKKVCRVVICVSRIRRGGYV